MPKDITKHAEELRRTSRLVSDAAKKYLARDAWTPIMGAMLLSGIHPSSHWTDIPILVAHQDHEPFSFRDLFRTLRLAMKKPERGLDGVDVYPDSDRFTNAENILRLWDALCSERGDYPAEMTPKIFVLGIRRLIQEGHAHLSEQMWMQVFANHYKLKNPDEVVPRSVLALEEVTSDERKLIPKHRFGKFIASIWVDTGKIVDPDVVLARLAEMMEKGAIRGFELVEYSHRSDLRYKQEQDKKPRVLRRDTLARQLRRMEVKDNASSDLPTPETTKDNKIPFVARIAVEQSIIKQFTEPEQLTELARKLMMEAVHYVRLAIQYIPDGGWERDLAVVVGNIARLSKLLRSIYLLASANLVDIVALTGCLAIEAIIDIEYLCTHFSSELINDYIQNSSENASVCGMWGGLDRLQRADAVGFRKTDFFDLEAAPQHVHGTWKIVSRFHLDETEGGRYYPNLRDATTHPQALLSLNTLALDATLSFMQITDRNDKTVDLCTAIEDLHRRLKKADDIFGNWFAQW